MQACGTHCPKWPSRTPAFAGVLWFEKASGTAVVDCHVIPPVLGVSLNKFSTVT
jgi:hypothetical protein